MDLEALHEGRNHGDVMFPLSVYKVEREHDDTIFNYHWHHETELIYMQQGSALFQIGTSVTELHAGEALFIQSGQLHAAYPMDGHVYRFHAIVFDLGMMASPTFDVFQSKYIGPLMQQELIPPTVIRPGSAWEMQVLHGVSELIQHYSQKQSGHELKIKADLYAIFSELLPHSQRMTTTKKGTASDSEKIERIKQVLHYMHEQYDHKIHIQELAALVHMSEGHFCRFFKSIVKQTPIEYLNFLRVNKAIQLLEDPHIKIIDVAHEVGFDNASYFIKTFKALKTYTPSEFRKRLNLHV
jgi:AraC-like DNA-binding protein